MQPASSLPLSPEALGHIFLTALHEILGTAGTRQLLERAALSPAIEAYQGNNLKLKLSAPLMEGILNAVAEEYGSLAGQGLLLRVGQTAFKAGLQRYGQELGVMELAFKLLPLNRKLTVFLRRAADLLNTLQPGLIQVEDAPDRIFCSIAGGMRLEWLVLGFLQEAVYWLSGGKSTRVESCQSDANDGCRLAVYKWD